MTSLRRDRRTARPSDRAHDDADVDDAAAIEARLISDLNGVLSAFRRSAYAPPIPGPLRRPRVAPPRSSANDDEPQPWVFPEYPSHARRRAARPSRAGRRIARLAVMLVALTVVVPMPRKDEPPVRHALGPTGPVVASIVPPRTPVATVAAPDRPPLVSANLPESSDAAVPVLSADPSAELSTLAEAADARRREAADLALAPSPGREPADIAPGGEDLTVTANLAPEANPMPAPPAGSQDIDDRQTASIAPAATVERSLPPIIVPWVASSTDEQGDASPTPDPSLASTEGPVPTELAAVGRPASVPAPEAIEAEPTPAAVEAEPVPEAAEPEAVPASAAAASRKIRLAVNMRAGPDNGDRVVAVIPAGRAFEVLGCKLWCEVAFNGKRGWVFKDLIDGKKAPARRVARASAPAAEAKPCKPGLAASALALVRRGLGNEKARPAC
ncbi:MAG: SH3 domain-containing protein [Bauldia sp.]